MNQIKTFRICYSFSRSETALVKARDEEEAKEKFWDGEWRTEAGEPMDDGLEIEHVAEVKA